VILIGFKNNYMNTTSSSSSRAVDMMILAILTVAQALLVVLLLKEEEEEDASSGKYASQDAGTSSPPGMLLVLEHFVRTLDGQSKISKSSLIHVHTSNKAPSEHVTLDSAPQASLRTFSSSSVD
jgi:hypothetical protein